MNRHEHALRTGFVVELELDRPAAHNALDSATLRSLETTCLELAAEPRLRAVLLTATGQSFAAGGDLREIREHANHLDAAPTLAAGRAALAALAALPVPVVAALDGAALGGGAELALAADVRFAGPLASLALRQARMALCPAWDTTRRLTQLLGYAAAAELLLLGLPASMERLAALGLARPAPRGARIEALEWAHTLDGIPPLALRANTRLLRAAYTDNAAAISAAERDVFTALFGQQEHREALAAFFERREPRF